MASTLAELVIKLHADVATFQRDMGRVAHISEKRWREIKRHAEESAKAVTVAASIAGAAIAKMGMDAINSADDLGKMAQRVGVSVEALSGLQYSARLAGVSSEQLSTGLRQLAKNAQDMAAGTGEARAAFQALGMSVTAAGGNLRGTEELLLELADRFARMEDGAGKTALAMKIFGRSGAELIPLLNQGAEGLKKNAEEARRFGLVISTETAKAAEAFNDDLTKIKASLDGIAQVMAASALPKLAEFTAELVEATRVTGNFLAGLNAMSNVRQFGDTPGEQVKNIEKALERTRELQKLFRGASVTQGVLGVRESNLLYALELAKRNMPDFIGDTGLPTRAVQLEKPPMLANQEALKDAQRVRDKVMKQQLEGEEELRRQSAEYAAHLREQETADVQREIEARKAGWQAYFAWYDKQQEDAIAAGAILAADVTENHKKLEDQTRRNTEVAREFGLTFSSNLEEAIVQGKKFRDVLQGIAQDMLRAFVRKQVTEPLLAVASEAFKGIFGGARAEGGPVSAGRSYLVGERGPELFTPGVGGMVTPNGGGGNTFYVDNRGASVEAVARLERFVAQLNGSIEPRAVIAFQDARARGRV